MFSSIKENTNNYSLALKGRDGKVLFANYLLTKPLTRHHIQQMIMADLKNKLQFGWVEVYSKKVQNPEQYTSLMVVKASYDYEKKENTIEEVLYEKLF